MRLLLARRPPGTSSFERALERHGVERLEVGPLSLGATRRLLAMRLSLVLSRRALRRVYETSVGNPLYALELGRMLAQRPEGELDQALTVPESIEELLGTHVADLPDGQRSVLLACALAGAPRASELVKVVGHDALEAGLLGGVVVADGERVRASHPLLAAAAEERSAEAERRALHRALAEVVEDAEVAAHHLALASAAADEELAARVEAAARAAATRGAVQDAASLAEHALRLTPPESPGRFERLFTLAERLDHAGEPTRITELLTPELPALPTGPRRARAHLLLSEGAVASMNETLEHLDRALAEGFGDPRVHAIALAKKATISVSTRVERIVEAETWALEALADAASVGVDAQRLALTALAWTRSLRGQPVDDVAAQFRAASEAAFHTVDSPERVVVARHSWRGEIAEARELLARLLELADERGEPWSAAVLRLDLCGLTMRSGEWRVVAAMLEEWLELPESELLASGPVHERNLAQLAAGLGRPSEAEERARRDRPRRGYGRRLVETRGAARSWDRSPPRSGSRAGSGEPAWRLGACVS